MKAQLAMDVAAGATRLYLSPAARPLVGQSMILATSAHSKPPSLLIEKFTIAQVHRLEREPDSWLDALWLWFLKLVSRPQSGAGRMARKIEHSIDGKRRHARITAASRSTVWP